MTGSLFCIIDTEPAFVDFKARQIIGAWGNLQVKRVSDLSLVGQASLFSDDQSAYLISLVTQDAVKAAASALSNLNSCEKVILTTSVSRVYTRKLENAVKQAGGEVVLAKANSKDRSNPVDTILAETSLSRDVKQYIVQYAGTDYSRVVPLLSHISNLDTRKQRRIEIDDIELRLPKPDGALLPWEIDKPLYAGNIPQLIRTYRRIRLHTHYLPVLSIVRKRVLVAFRVKGLQTGGIKSRSQLVKALDETDNYPFQLAVQLASRKNLTDLSRALAILERLDSDLKGGSSADADALCEIALIKLCNLLS